MVPVGQEDLGTKDADLKMTCVCVAWLVSGMSSVRDQEEDMLAAAVDQYLEQRFLEAFCSLLCLSARRWRSKIHFRMHLFEIPGELRTLNDVRSS